MKELPRRLTLLDAASVLIGSVIGGGIFLVPSVIARHLPSAQVVLLVWLVAGLVSFFGALAFAELGAMMPATGGQYVFLREAYGPLCAFLCAWTLFLVTMAAQISSLAIGFSIYAAQLISLTPTWSKALSVALIVLLSAINYRATQGGAFVQKLFLFLKLAGIAVLIAAAFSAKGAIFTGPANFSEITAGGLGLATVACLLAYDGWNIVSFIAGEVERPQRNLPLALGLGVAFVALVYMLANAAFLRILSISEIAATDRVGAAVATRTLGPVGATLVTVTILLSIVGSLNGTIMTPPRIYFTQARDRLFFARFGEVHPKFETPAFAIAIQAIWATLLALTGTYERLISLAVFAAWIFYALTAAGVIVLRRKRPHAPRPYRMWGYPFSTVLFVAVAVWFVVSTFVQSPGTSAWALFLILSGVPVFYLWRRKAA
ncbi:MAG: amino acid permease [Acidobacteriota bacterium]|nr:amino acid permease [Acidobacteriota bacterium]